MLSLILLVGLGSAEAQDELVEAGLSEVELTRFREGMTALDEGRYKDAQGRFWRVHLTNRGHPQTLEGLGRAYWGEGKLAEASKWFEQCAHLLDECALASGQLANLAGDYAQAVDRLVRLEGELGADVQPEVHWALVEAYLGNGQSQEALQSAIAFAHMDFGEEGWSWREEQSTHLASLIVALREDLDALRPWELDVDGRWEALLSLLRALEEFELHESLVEELAAESLRIEVEQAARRRFGGIDVALTQAQQQQVGEAKRSLSARAWLEAEGQIARLLDQAPRSSEAWGLRGRLSENRTDKPDWVEAERAYRGAHKLAPNNPEWGRALVGLLTEAYGGRRDAEALPVLRNLVAQHPLPEFQLQLAELLRKLGDYSGAESAFRAYLLRWPNGEEAAKVRKAIAALDRALPGALASEIPLPKPAETVRQGAQWHYHLSVVYQGRSLRSEALSHAEVAVDLQSNWPLALNHLAGLLSEDTPRKALVRLEESLALAPTQTRVRVQKIDLLFRLKQDASAEQALRDLAVDAPEYHFRLAVLEEARTQRDAAQKALESYFDLYTGERFRADALDLQASIVPQSGRTRWIQLALGMALLFGLGALVWARRRKKTGISLHEFLQEEPRCYHDLARVLSGMRHEVLKHNTTLLPSVAEALERGDRGPALDASGILIGGQGAPGVIALWERYVSELESIGQAHGRRLNLRHTDPQIGPMCQAFRALQQLAPQLHKGKPGQLVPQIRAISHAVNEVGYAELGKLLHEVCVLEVDQALLEAAWRRVSREPGLVGRGLSEPLLSLECRVQVRAFREDLVDILANLLRNACDAVLEESSEGECRVGIRVLEEMDPVTGLSWVAIRVLDNAARPFSNEMLKGRNIGRGVGLAMDLAKRSQGSLKVEEEEGWSKAVVLRLAVAEEIEA
jgi:tetratricopeptide (TPR) repeat protein